MASTRPRPAVFRALGRQDPPRRVLVGGTWYEMLDCLKHDSWAATALYENPAKEVVVCKFNRQQRVGPIPMKWLGRRLARREQGLMELLEDVPHVARSCGPIAAEDASGASKTLDYAVGHTYVTGRPLKPGQRVDDLFFERLRATLKALHTRGVAYVDLHKAENVIVADDGSPCLIDYQVCFWPQGIAGRLWPIRWILGVFQRMDDYHLMKHIIRCRPDLLPPDQRDIRMHRPAWIRAWRKVATPLRTARRRLLVLIGVRAKGGKASTERHAEEAYREPG